MRSLFLFALLLAASAASAQITLRAADFEALYSRSASLTSAETTAPDGLAALAARSGPGQTWDFSALAFGEPTTTTMSPAGPNPPGSSDPVFSLATHVVEASAGPDSVSYVYYRVVPTAVELLGIAAETEGPDGQPTLARVRYNPGSVQYGLPLAFGAAWASASDVLVALDLPGWPAFESRERREGTVDGWGTLVTPAGSAPALRVWTTVWTESDIVTPDGPITIRDSSATVEFVTAGALSATILLDGDGAPISATYGVAGASSSADDAPDAGVRLAVVGANPVPAGTPVRVAFSAAVPATVEVFDVLGRRVAVLADGSPAREATWQTGGQAPGIYLVRLRAGAETATVRVALVH